MFKKIHPSLVFLSILVIRCAVYGADIGDAIALAASAALYGFFLYTEAHKPVPVIPINDAFVQDLAQLRSTVDALKLGRSFKL